MTAHVPEAGRGLIGKWSGPGTEHGMPCRTTTKALEVMDLVVVPHCDVLSATESFT